jgi:hypothetical protein
VGRYAEERAVELLGGSEVFDGYTTVFMPDVVKSSLGSVCYLDRVWIVSGMTDGEARR